MSQSALKEKAEKRSKFGVWWNNIFRTKLEIKSDKILEMMQHSNDNEVRGDTTFYYSRGGLQDAVVEKLGHDPQYIKLNSLTVTYWCDVPKKLWDAFQSDAKFNSDLYDEVNKLTNRLVGEWGKRLIHWERFAAEAEAKGDQEGVNRAIQEFDKDCVTLSKECEQVAIETIASYFSEKVKTYGDYTRYKVKAGAKLTFTFIGIVASIAALSTAATPAAPATLVPAIIGLVSAAMSMGKQIADLAANAEEIEAEIMLNLQGIEVNYKDKNGKPRKKTYQAREFTVGFVSGLTGGCSDMFIPSISGLLSLTGLHKSKLDGLDTTLHDMGIGINGLCDGLVNVDKVLQDNLTKLADAAKSKPNDPEIKKAQKAIDAAMKTFEKVNEDFLNSFEKIVSLGERIKAGRESNEKLKESLEKIEAALKTKNFAMAGGILATLVVTGIGFAGGAPSHQIEKITTYTSVAWTGIDMVREYTPDVMEQIFA